MIKKLRYKLSQKAFDSVTKNVDPNSGIQFEEWKKKKASKCLTVITESAPDSRYLTFFVPVVHKEQIFGATLPQPSSLFLNQAKVFSNNVDKLKDEFPNNIKVTFKDVNNNLLNLIDEDFYYSFLSYKISTLSSIVMFVESYLNSIIPEDFKMENKHKIMIGKETIERHWTIKDKLTEVIPKIVEIGDQKDYNKKYNKFLEINNLRNNFIHLKSAKDGRNMDPYIIHFEELINLDLNKSIKNTEELIKVIEPNYFDNETITS